MVGVGAVMSLGGGGGGGEMSENGGGGGEVEDEDEEGGEGEVDERRDDKMALGRQSRLFRVAVVVWDWEVW